MDIPVFKRKSLTLAQAREKARIGRELDAILVDGQSWIEKAEKRMEKLKAEGFATDMQPHSDDDRERISLHARKSMRLVAEEVSALTERFKALARELGGHYDGWTVRRGA